MLKLDKMEISGFKSFSDKTEIVFPGGITAVVGPNGCGKSNIGDAINWVLGEQSPKMLRGRQMSDVIFAGSRARKALGMAEVSLHLGGAEGLAHVDQGRMVITRRLFRSGDSEYLINGSRTRLKDIQEFLREGRVGKIDQVLSAKPRDRRLIIEDAAGIAGYKHKRRLTELKLEATQANLLRVNDIVVEVQRQINSLKRQASKARRYKRLRDELRESERLHFALRARDLERELAGATQSETTARDAESAVAAELARGEVEVTDRRGGLEEANRAYREASERAHALEIEIDRQEGQIRGCQERIAESERISERQSSQAAELEARQEETRRRSSAHGEQVATGREALTALRRNLESAQQELQGAELAVRRGREAGDVLRQRQFESMHRAAELRNRLHRVDEALRQSVQQRGRLEAERETVDEDRVRLEGESTTLVDEHASSGARVAELETALVRSEQEVREAAERRHGWMEPSRTSRRASPGSRTACAPCSARDRSPACRPWAWSPTSSKPAPRWRAPPRGT
jgi:chromosome segregation protein